ncbi:hypothetical protein BX661DRAFT_195167 [Kickxella alabastrina]|uniref:uncharacterized protein n=1 Tax=Kickxella alabastrina TaxID=61397 RepID=UPI002220265B|nr:uncharacterized protein BX661DRAFT_195167 [Kickxella alabastrina]KAI7834535.1 hypothetical protein BX661DRAFT_195167 [Kickxella alabastrina]
MSVQQFGTRLVKEITVAMDYKCVLDDRLIDVFFNNTVVQLQFFKARKLGMYLEGDSSQVINFSYAQIRVHKFIACIKRMAPAVMSFDIGNLIRERDNLEITEAFIGESWNELGRVDMHYFLAGDHWQIFQIARQNAPTLVDLSTFISDHADFCNLIINEQANPVVYSSVTSLGLRIRHEHQSSLILAVLDTQPFSHLHKLSPTVTFVLGDDLLF